MSNKTSSKAKAQARTERAQAMVAEAKRKQRRKSLISYGAVALAVVVIIGAAFFISRGNDSSKDISAAAAGGSDLGLTIGDEAADHTIVVYEDFLCPICGQLESSSRETFAQLASDGDALIEYRPFVLLSRLGDYSARSANAFRVVQQAAGDDVAKKFHDLLFENQPSEEGPFPDSDALVDLAVEAGAAEDDVRSGVEDAAQQDWVDTVTRDAQDAGVNATPTILLDGEAFSDGRTFDDIVANLSDAVQK